MKTESSLERAILNEIQRNPSISDEDLRRKLFNKGFRISIDMLTMKRYEIQRAYEEEREFQKRLLEANKRMKALKEEAKYSFTSTYLGGHLEYPISGVEGYIRLTENYLYFIPKRLIDGKFVTFETSLDDIEDLEIVTEKEITLKRFLLLGHLALAFPEKKRYLKLTFSDRKGLKHHPIFHVEDLEGATRTLCDVLRNKHHSKGT